MKVKLCMQVKFDTTIMVFKQHVCNNVTCLKQQQQPLAIHYDRDHSHSIVSNNVLVGRVAGLHVIIHFRIFVLDMT